MHSQIGLVIIQISWSIPSSNRSAKINIFMVDIAIICNITIVDVRIMIGRDFVISGTKSVIGGFRIEIFFIKGVMV